MSCQKLFSLKGDRHVIPSFRYMFFKGCFDFWHFVWDMAVSLVFWVNQYRQVTIEYVMMMWNWWVTLGAQGRWQILIIKVWHNKYANFSGYVCYVDACIMFRKKSRLCLYVDHLTRQTRKVQYTGNWVLFLIIMKRNSKKINILSLVCTFNGDNLL